MLHGIIVAVMVLVWSGSLLYIGLGEGARLLVGGILWSRPNRLLLQSGSVLLAAALIAPWVAMAPVSAEGPFSSTALSWLQVLVLVGVGTLAAAMAGFERRRPETRPPMRALRAMAFSLVIGIPMLAIPGLLETLGAGVLFVSGEDTWAMTNPEQQPLFSTVSQSLRRSPTARFGWLVYLIPALPVLVGAGLRRRERRESVVLLLLWTTALTVLTLRQVRFANDLAPRWPRSSSRVHSRRSTAGSLASCLRPLQRSPPLCSSWRCCGLRSRRSSCPVHDTRFETSLQARNVQWPGSVGGRARCDSP